MSILTRPSLIEISPQSVRPSALPDHVYAVLKQQILSCVLKPDERLIEKRLCEELRVSRTPLREALNRLSHEELLSFQPHAGYRVASITINSFRNLIELRAIVEPQAAALAAQRATEEDIADLRACASLPYDPNDDRGFVDYCRANAKFHLRVVRTARNAALENIVMSALDLYQRPTYLKIGRQLDPKNPSAKHIAITEAIAQHNVELARDIMLQHITGGGERILAALSAAGYS
jgi:GntR family transcriptional regulator, rspAB operon transcriptional repressor